MSAREYAPETRAAVLAALLAGQSVSAVAREYQIPKGTVSAWKNRTAIPDGAATVAVDATQKADDVGDLLVQLVKTNLKGLITAAELMQDRAWLKQQGAAELGTFLGITHDKTVRMLEAMERAGLTDAEPEATA